MTEKGSRIVRRNIRGIGTAATGSAGKVGLLRSALLGVGSALVIRQFARVSDSMTQIQNRLRLVTRDEAELTAVTNELLKISESTRASFEGTAETYARTALSVRDLGISQRETLDFTKALNQAIILSGATAQEARNGLIQFSQGLSSNRLAGDELRSTLEQLPLIADVIAKQFGVARGALRELAAQGKITAKDILLAFGPETQAEIQQAFDLTTATISQSFTVLNNKLIEFTGGLNEATGLAGGAARVILRIAQNFDFFGRVILGGVVTLGILTVAAALKTLTVALLANPITAIAIAVLAATSALAAFSDLIIVSSDGLTTLQDVGLALFSEFASSLGVLVSSARESLGIFLQVIGIIASESNLTFTDVLQGAAVFADRFVGVFVGVGKAIVIAVKSPARLIESIFVSNFNAVLDALEILTAAITSVFFGIGVAFRDFGLRMAGSISLINEALNQLAVGNFQAASDFLKEATFQITSGTKGLAANVSRNIKKEFAALRVEDILPRIEGPALNRAADTGAAIGQAFVEGFEGTTGVQDLVGRALSRASGKSAERELKRLQAEGANLGQKISGGGAGGLSLQEVAIRSVTERLERRNEVMKQTIGLGTSQSEVLSRLLKVEDQLARKGIELTDVQRAGIQATIQQNVALDAQANILNRLNGTLSNAQFEMEQLTILFQNGQITASQFKNEVKNLETSIAAAERELDPLSGTIQDFAAQTELTIVNAFNAAEDALVQFAKTGEISISGLVDSVLADLTRLLARQAIVGLLTSIGGSGGGLGSLANTALSALSTKANGGPTPGGEDVLVGERGPEIFRPDGPGSIVPAGQTAAMAAPAPAPEVKVSVVNLIDPAEVEAALATPAGEKAILNVIRRNPQAIRSLQ